MKVEGITAYQDKITLILSEVSAEPLPSLLAFPLSVETAPIQRITDVS